ncbi:long-chain-fatty-acid--CoA ligase [Thermoflavimicrobium dichotomicum]|uniref:Long-chain acyl-CoA synthetase n=1 Tax=Thermoflavimicrobium dichotomicum TaxID=46223 RepID=A0A1I3L769_9BACL|nr:long-chain fatty acid--CoA ligase [Thermoflavimicrobium dichotomicum]SFI80285.1 long-chain acyl-CoA synthetase [Thermoflavimicrobium dichotomicum]
MGAENKPWLKHYPKQIPESIEYPDISIAQLLIDTAKDFPNHEAIIFMGKRLTFQQLLDQVYSFANALKRLGVKPGERVSIMLPNCPQAVVAYYASLMIGAIVVQTNPLYMERELEHQLNDSDAETIICLDLVLPKVLNVKEKTKLQRVIVTGIADVLPFPKNWLYKLKLMKDGMKVEIPTGPEFYSMKQLIAEEVPTPLKPVYHSKDDVALLQYTGGTTGLSKGAMLTHRNLISNTYQITAWTYKAKRGQEKVLGVLPFFHVYGLTTLMHFAIHLASTMILVPRFDATMILKEIEKHRPTYFPGAPTMYIGLINHPDIGRYDLSSIEACLSGSAPLPVEVQEAFEKLSGGKLIEGYGLTETSPVTHANLIYDRVKHSTIGLPLPDTECRIVNPDTGEEVSVGEAGELQIRGPQVMKGYWKRPEETKAVLKDGWLNTGDIGKMDEDGYFYILDRKKDVIIAGGYNIYPREVEEVLYEHPAIQEAVVVGVPHEYRGETVKAYIVLKEGQKLTEKEVEKYCREKLAAYKIPRIVEFRKELPKSNVGKILRRVLREEAVREFKKKKAN